MSWELNKIFCERQCSQNHLKVMLLTVVVVVVVVVVFVVVFLVHFSLRWELSAYELVLLSILVNHHPPSVCQDVAVYLPISSPKVNHRRTNS